MSDRDELGKTHLSASQTERRAAVTRPADAERTAAPERYTVPEGVSDPELGRGGMGRVLRLRDPHLEREVAVKELLSHHRDDPLVEALFAREARVLARLEHPGVVPVYEMGRRADGTPFYAMRRVRGDSLSRVMEACATLEDRLALMGHFLTVVQTMGFAHSRHVVHRDLKPENVMVSRYGETQVIDWGLAVVDAAAPEGGLSAGTPAYMSPEQASGTGVDERSDVWSLGVMLYELLTGKLPFDGGSATEVMSAVQQATPEPIRQVERRAPSAVVAVANKAMQRTPSERYANAGDMADALEAALREKPSTTRGPMLVALSLGLALVVSLGWGWSLRTRASDVQRDARLAVGDATRTRDEALAGAALRALRDRDAFQAAKLAATASTHPLARGVALLATEAGVPERLWSVKTGAGCSSLAVDGELVACASFTSVPVYDVRSGNLSFELKTGPRGWQQAVAVLPGHRLATGGDDRQVRLFDLSTRGHLSTSENYADSITSMAADDTRLVVGLHNGHVVGAGEELQQHSRPVLQVAASHGVTASTSGAALQITRHDDTSVLDRRAGALAWLDDSLVIGVERTVAQVDASGLSKSWGTHHHDVTAIAVLANQVVTGSADGELRWWSRDGELLSTATVAASEIRALSAHDDVVVVATGLMLEAWHYRPVRHPIWDDTPTAEHASTSRAEVYAGFHDGRVRRYELGAPRAGAPLEIRHTAMVRCLSDVPGAERPTGFRVLSGGDDGKVLAQRWNGEVEVLDAQPATRVLSLGVSLDGTRAAWGLDDGSLVFYSLELEKEIARAHGSLVRALAFAPSGLQLAVGRDDRVVAVHDAQVGSVQFESNAFDAPVTAVAWASRQVVVAARADGQVSDLSLETHERLHLWSGATSRVNVLAVSGNRLAAGTQDGQAWVWNLERAGGPDYQVPADASGVLAVGFASDALVVAGADEVVHVLGR